MADLNGSETPWSVSPIVIDIERDKIDYCVYIDKEGETVVLGRKEKVTISNPILLFIKNVKTHRTIQD